MFRSENIIVAPGWENLLHARGLDGVDAIYRMADGEVITHSGSTEVRRIELSEGGVTRTVFVKKYWAVSARQLWSGALRGTFLGRSKARREFENLARLRAWGLDAPSPVACGEERCAGWLMRSFLISEGVADPLPLDLFIQDFLPSQPESPRRLLRRDLIQRLADYTRRLHECRFVHHDYFWRNILLSGASLEHFWLIDAHKGRRWFPGTQFHSRAKDLATLDAPAPHFFRRAERLWFFLCYAGRPKLTGKDKRFIRRVLRLAAPLREQQLRRVLDGRRVQPQPQP
jgi:tRNA A-37 threonylcarbamoyl transferase component Bud32